MKSQDKEMAIEIYGLGRAVTFGLGMFFTYFAMKNYFPFSWSIVFTLDLILWTFLTVATSPGRIKNASQVVSNDLEVPRLKNEITELKAEISKQKSEGIKVALTEAPNTVEHSASGLIMRQRALLHELNNKLGVAMGNLEITMEFLPKLKMAELSGVEQKENNKNFTLVQERTQKSYKSLEAIQTLASETRTFLLFDAPALIRDQIKKVG